MKLKVIASSSSGNGYALEGKEETLLLEAGVPLSMVRKKVSDFRTIVGCLVSHRHGDHAKYIADYTKAGIKVYAHEDVFCGDNGNGRMSIDNGAFIHIGGFNVMAFNANHDVPCLAFFIYHKEMGRLAFITDSSDFGYSLHDVNHMLIECNWSEELLQQAVEDGRTPAFVAKRVRETHMSIDDAIGYIREEVSMESLREIVMLHLSHENSDQVLFTEKMVEAFHKPTFVATDGLDVVLMKGGAE